MSVPIALLEFALLITSMVCLRSGHRIAATVAALASIAIFVVAKAMSDGFCGSGPCR